MVRYGRDKEQMKRIIEENREAYNNIDSRTREVLEVVAKVKIPEECKVVKNGETRFEMCKAFEDYRLGEKLEGMQERLIQMVCKKLMKNKPAMTIADELEEDLSEVERIKKKKKRVGSYDAAQICGALAKSDFKS